MKKWILLIGLLAVTVSQVGAITVTDSIKYWLPSAADSVRWRLLNDSARVADSGTATLSESNYLAKMNVSRNINRAARVEYWVYYTGASRPVSFADVFAPTNNPTDSVSVNNVSSAGATALQTVIWVSPGIATRSVRVQTAADTVYQRIAKESSDSLMSKNIGTYSDGAVAGSVYDSMLIWGRTSATSFPTNFSLLAIDGSGRVTTGTNADKTGYSLTQAFPTNFSSMAITVGGAVTAGTVSDKTGYSLTQSFPSNFGALAITVGGAVTAGTVSDKTGYSLAASQSFSTTGAVGSVTAGVTASTVSDKTGYSLATSQSFSTTGAVGSVTGGVTVTTNNDKTGYRLSTLGVDDVWDEAQSGHVTAGTYGYNLDARVSTLTSTGDWSTDEKGQIRYALGLTGATVATTGTGILDLTPRNTWRFSLTSDSSNYTAASAGSYQIQNDSGLFPTGQDLADVFWETNDSFYDDIGTMAYRASQTASLSAAVFAAAVADLDTATHGIAGTFGRMWQRPILYGTQSFNNSGSWTGNVSSVTSVTNAVTVGTNNDKTGYSLSAGGTASDTAFTRIKAQMDTIVDTVVALLDSLQDGAGGPSVKLSSIGTNSDTAFTRVKAQLDTIVDTTVAILDTLQDGANGPVVYATVSDKTGFSLSSGGVDAVEAGVWGADSATYADVPGTMASSASQTAATALTANGLALALWLMGDSLADSTGSMAAAASQTTATSMTDATVAAAVIAEIIGLVPGDTSETDGSLLGQVVRNLDAKVSDAGIMSQAELDSLLGAAETRSVGSKVFNYPVSLADDTAGTMGDSLTSAQYSVNVNSIGGYAGTAPASALRDILDGSGSAYGAEFSYLSLNGANGTSGTFRIANSTGPGIVFNNTGHDIQKTGGARADFYVTVDSVRGITASSGGGADSAAIVNGILGIMPADTSTDDGSILGLIVRNLDAPISGIESPAGNGLYTRYITVVDTSTTPDSIVQRVTVTVNNVDQSGDPLTATTGTSGTATFNLNAGTWVRMVDWPGFVQRVDTFTVVGVRSDTLRVYRVNTGMTPISFQINSPGRGPTGSPLPSQYAIVTAVLFSDNDSTTLSNGDSLVIGNIPRFTVADTASASGQAYLYLYPNATFTNDSTWYEVTIRDRRGLLLYGPREVRVPASDTALSFTSSAVVKL